MTDIKISCPEGKRIRIPPPKKCNAYNEKTKKELNEK